MIDAQECSVHLGKCTTALRKAYEREKTDQRFDFEIRTAKREIDRAFSLFGNPAPHERRARMARTALEACRSAVSAVERNTVDQAKVLGSAERAVERFKETVT